MQINYAKKQVSCKIVYYGPGMSGKTTNLEIVYEKVPKNNKGEMTSIATEGDRTLFFDFLPLDLGQVRGLTTKFQLYTVPGQIYYASTRKLVLQGADGIIFVADSSASKLDENIESLNDLKNNLKEYGITLEEIPIVIQWNKRDLPDAMDVDELNRKINLISAPWIEAEAASGKGVLSTLKTAASLVLERLNSGNESAKSEQAKPEQVKPEQVKADVGNPKEENGIYVAKVNDDKISRDYYNQYCQIQYRLSAHNVDTLEDYKKFTKEEKMKLLESLINYALLLQDAKRRSIVVSKGELGKQLELFTKKFKTADDMNKFLIERRLTTDNLTNEATKNVITSKMVSEVIPNLAEKMKISEQDVKEFYNRNKEKFGDSPISEVKETLIKMVKNDRKRELLDEFFHTLRKNAKIDIFSDKL